MSFKRKVVPKVTPKRLNLIPKWTNKYKTLYIWTPPGRQERQEHQERQERQEPIVLSRLSRTEGRRWSPPRGLSIRRPPKVCAACWTGTMIVGLEPILFSFPGASRWPPTSPQEAVICCLLVFFLIFCPSKLHSKFCIEKKLKKNAKINDFGLPNPSQNLSKMLPKSRSHFRG